MSRTSGMSSLGQTSLSKRFWPLKKGDSNFSSVKTCHPEDSSATPPMLPHPWPNSLPRPKPINTLRWGLERRSDAVTTVHASNNATSGSQPSTWTDKSPPSQWYLTQGSGASFSSSPKRRLRWKSTVSLSAPSRRAPARILWRCQQEHLGSGALGWTASTCTSSSVWPVTWINTKTLSSMLRALVSMKWSTSSKVASWSMWDLSVDTYRS